MPELPEVETVRNAIAPMLVGRRNVGGEFFRPEVAAFPDAESFLGNLFGARATGLRRRGKFLLIDWDSGHTLAVHLRMTGRLAVLPPEVLLEKHTHAVFLLDNGWSLRFMDARRFGRLWLANSGEEGAVAGLNRLGMEPFDPDLTPEFLFARLHGRAIPIKSALLDQSVVAGVGNIYSDEILFRAKISPMRRASELKMDEWQALAREIPRTLRFAIEKNAMTPEEYLFTRGANYKGGFFQVYERQGKPCPRCGEGIVKIFVGGRGAHYCPRCQPAGAMVS